MSNQSISLVEFSELYNILLEIKHVFSFKIHNFETKEFFLKEFESNKGELSNSLIVLNPKNNKITLNNQIKDNSILLIKNLPLSIDKIIFLLNTKLIAQRYKFQSALIVMGYTLDINSRIIKNRSAHLKLTEKEINIILHLNEQTQPQSIQILQSKVWGYSFGDLETHTVETHIYRLRKKIKDTFKDKNFIKSYDTGYMI